MIRRLIRVLWLFVPGHSRYLMWECGRLGSDLYQWYCLFIYYICPYSQHQVIPWQERPLDLQDLSRYMCVQANLFSEISCSYYDYRVKLVGLNSQVQNALGAHLKVRLE